ncbi:hypothetical protein ACFOGJ_18065 [Marinibaculum pumilum]|uniref:SlyX family protein n=1 Tax=Marinibaculum pumilum TaxID=1766165 RepID=A0ABV7L4H1_9PROT
MDEETDTPQAATLSIAQAEKLIEDLWALQDRVRDVRTELQSIWDGLEAVEFQIADTVPDDD